jgi:hypothetical protein
MQLPRRNPDPKNSAVLVDANLFVFYSQLHEVTGPRCTALIKRIELKDSPPPGWWGHQESIFSLSSNHQSERRSARGDVARRLHRLSHTSRRNHFPR